MGKVMIINASPRAPKSNSKQYANLFAKYCRLDTEYYEVKKSNHLTLCQMIENYSDIVFVFPLYVDSVPVTLLNFLKAMEDNALLKKPTISVVINCGFIEPYQNDIAVKMLQLFARKNGYPYGSTFKIGSGEAILTTPFRIFLKERMKRFAVSIERQRYNDFQVTMPISKKCLSKHQLPTGKIMGRRMAYQKKKWRLWRLKDSL